MSDVARRARWLRPWGAAARRWGSGLTAPRAVAAVELALLALLAGVLLSGGRAAVLDRLGSRADVAALLLAAGVLLPLHVAARRRLLPWLERRIAPGAYDEHRILFDLTREAHGADSIDELYRFIVDRIGAAVETDSAAIFVRDEASGDFVLRISTRDAGAADAAASAAKDEALRLRDGAFVVRRLRNLRRPLVLTPADYDAWSRAFAGEAEPARRAREDERRTLERVGAHVLVHVRARDRLVGILALGARRAGHLYASTDMEMLMSVAGQLALVIENARLAERMVAEDRMRRDLSLAAEVQQRLFPAASRVSGAVELAGYCQPARGVGGDYYDFLSFGSAQVGVAVADVSGKGIPAALLMASVQASLRSQALANDASADGITPACLVTAMNRLVCSSTRAASYVTFFYAQLDERTLQLTYVNAGHNPPLLVRASAAGPQFSRLEKGGTVMGFFDDAAYEQETVQLRAGDLLLAYTDGVTEAMRAEEQEFGEERLRGALADVHHLAADDVRDALVRRLQEWCAGVPQHDDLTFVAMKVR